eukprot:m.117301 g.117301  ORF g.117301 m.117301 type:complete len:342 (+) comp10941_c0_seq1:241-1266(+)
MTMDALQASGWLPVVVVAVVVPVIVALVGWIARQWAPRHAVVSALYVHPIKGCRAAPVLSARVDRLGLEGDRRLMLIEQGAEAEGATHRFVSQREVAKMATIVPSLSPQGMLHVDAPGMKSLELDPRPGPQRRNFGSRQVQVWDDVVTAQRISTDADAWFSQYLERPVELVAIIDVESHRRPLHKKYFDSSTTAFDVAAPFSDGYPMLLLPEASIEDLNDKLPKEARPVPATSFRPNVVIAGTSTAWDEDTWGRVRVGEVEMQLVKPCSRCQVPNVHQETGKRRARFEPLRTLREFRGFGDDVFVGENAVQLNLGTIHVGDAVHVLERREPRVYGKATEAE